MSLAASPSHLRSTQSAGRTTGRPHPAATSENTATLLRLTSAAATLAPIAGSRLILQETPSGTHLGQEDDDSQCPMRLAA